MRQKICNIKFIFVFNNEIVKPLKKLNYEYNVLFPMSGNR